ncbi:hypothetical protein CHU98_g8555 [Xylaria longipes]|nr:hypothetical protein CHU98_g8555 [Xylaria longipes]
MNGRRKLDVGTYVRTTTFPICRAQSGFKLGLGGRERLIGTSDRSLATLDQEPESMVTGSHLWIVVPFAGTGGEERTTNPGWKYVHLASMSATTTYVPTISMLGACSPASRLQPPRTTYAAVTVRGATLGDFMSKKTQGHHFHILDTPSADRYCREARTASSSAGVCIFSQPVCDAAFGPEQAGSQPVAFQSERLSKYPDSTALDADADTSGYAQPSLLSDTRSTYLAGDSHCLNSTHSWVALLLHRH